MVLIVWSKNALLDLEDIKNYISNGIYTVSAETTVRKLLDVAIILRKHPSLGTIVPNTETRQLFVENYRIIYQFRKGNPINQDDIIYILRITHTKQLLRL